MGERILVAGGGGFIGGWLAKTLISQGHEVRCVDIKPVDQWYQVHETAENLQADLSLLPEAERVVEGTTRVFNLAADMGGMGFIELNKAKCMLSVLINTHLLMAAQRHGVDDFFFSSSACVYRDDLQSVTDGIALKEQDAYPAMPEDGYGWEKLFGERMCRHFSEDFGLRTHVARYHNVYGPHGTWDGGREKAPAAISRKVAQAVLSGVHEIEIWGDGEQTRSFTYIDDAVEGTLRLTQSRDFFGPVNIGSSEMVSINQLVSIVEDIAGVKLKRNHILNAPLGVRGRNSDNGLVVEKLGWEPNTPLKVGMARTYEWVLEQVKSGRSGLQAECK